MASIKFNLFKDPLEATIDKLTEYREMTPGEKLIRLTNILWLG